MRVCWSVLAAASATTPTTARPSRRSSFQKHCSSSCQELCSSTPPMLCAMLSSVCMHCAFLCVIRQRCAPLPEPSSSEETRTAPLLGVESGEEEEVGINKPGELSEGLDGLLEEDQDTAAGEAEVVEADADEDEEEEEEGVILFTTAAAAADMRSPMVACEDELHSLTSDDGAALEEDAPDDEADDETDSAPPVESPPPEESPLSRTPLPGSLFSRAS
mmetsp:Transcript_7855/g.24262  ORF Transcript_7855/g.24262 Transcript_7855/m.24262 type:complete len:218 (+) Transcript_7855:2236-2889(+)